MKTIKLNQYGSVLTGREFGTQVWTQISKDTSTPIELDFEGVESMGSSFGDEVIPPIAKAQGNSLRLHNVNDDVKSVIRDVATDAEIAVQFV